MVACPKNRNATCDLWKKFAVHPRESAFREPPAGTSLKAPVTSPEAAINPEKERDEEEEILV